MWVLHECLLGHHPDAAEHQHRCQPAPAIASRIRAREIGRRRGRAREVSSLCVAQPWTVERGTAPERLRRDSKRTTVRCAPMMTIRFRRACRRPLAIAVPLLLTLAVSAAAQPRLALQPHDRVMLVGNTLAERQQLFNHFETSLLTRFPELELTVRNLGWSGDTPALQPRPLNFGDAATHLTAQRADVILAFFGLNESFAGEAGVAAFERDLEAWVTLHRAARYNGTDGAAARAGVADRARAAGAARPRRRRGAQPRAGPLHRGDALAGGAARRPVRRRVHADAGGDGRLAGAADDQRHPPERDRRSRVRRDPDDGARLRAGPVRHLGDGGQGLRRRCASRCGPRTSSGSIASGR